MHQTKKPKGSASGSSQMCDSDRPEPQQHADPREEGSSPDGKDTNGQQDLGDAQIIKSPSDPKHYRYIELSNGLRALLISDMSGAGNIASDEESEDGEQEQDSDFEELDEDSDGKKKKGSSEKQSAAALCVGVGSFSDPEDLPGLAHFLEHSESRLPPVDWANLRHRFCSNFEKYPAENGFDAFLKKHGGSDNASTDCERTIFQFDVQRKHFREAMDRWAQFFICPLMIKDAIEREVEAVDSEYQLARPSDSHRKEMLFGSLAKPSHPMGKFCWGNAQTLKHDPREKNIDTYVRLREFWKRHYSAHYMTLTVQSKETLDTLDEWVREIFSKVPNNGQLKPTFSHLLDPFDTPAFNKLYRVVPVRKVHALTITWALPPQGTQCRVKPLHYVSWLVAHEGPGSILSLLRKKCWALSLFGGNSETGFDQNTTYSIFSISTTLTDEGFQNFYQVIHLLFQYLKMLQTVGPQQRIYEEIQKIEANEFQYQEQTDPIEYVQNICENMQLFPKEDFLTGDQLMFQYNPEVISSALTLLTPERANLQLLSPEHEGRCGLKERWFGTQYSVEDIEQEWRDRWAGDFELNSELHLPAENKFIATDFTLKTSDCPDTEYPVRIINSEKGCLWFKKDNKFKIPRAYVHFHLLSPVIQKSPENLVLFDVLVNVLAHNLAEPAYEADVAQLEYKLVAGEHGLMVKVKGFNHKLPGRPAADPEHHRWSTVQKYRAVTDGLSVTDLMEPASSLKSEMYAEGLVQGNFTSAKSPENLVLFDVLVNVLAHNLAEPAYEADVAQLEYKLVAGEHGLMVKVKGFNHKLPLLLNLIVDHLAHFTAAPEVFSMFAEQLKKTYFNILIKPERLGKDVRLQILEHHRWSTVQKYRAVTDGLSVTDLMEFASSLKSEMYAEGLVQGNFTSAESVEFLQYVIDKLQFRNLPEEVPVRFRVVELPQKHHLCKVKSLNKGDANSEVTVYYQSGLKNLQEHTMMELLVMHLEEPCFDFLRTKETLGYQVYPTCRNTSGVLGFSVTVETQATKFSTDLVEMKIEEFLVNFGGKMSTLTDEAFRTQVTALVKLKECEDTHLGEEVDRNWFEVVTQQYVFDRLSKEIEALRLITKPELVSCFMEHRHAGSRKLSVHVVGFGEEENDLPGEDPCSGTPERGERTSSYGEVSRLTFLPASPPLAEATAITDIRAFTSTLTLHPYHKILK
ncbi:hypothetical protein AAFF_G00032270 [Aldrovandia affinis]|uniref:Nardilysin n=1 Tax=Aldrovandia affinis TaxID=143900 RepID=A0AAD7S465_9TELE|nr:hypothetical protein AAFF_G00032270 [Aldrovandia affinis]